MTLPRVTEILAEVGIIDTRRYAGYSEQRDRGSAVHAACHYDDIGDLDESSLDPSWIPYLQGWRKFRSEHVCQWTDVEKRLSNESFTGQPDRRGTVDAHRAIVDLKTGAKESWHKIQLAAYCVLTERPFCYRRIVVRLQDDGNYAMDNYSLATAEDINLFLSAVAIFNWKRRTNGNGNR